MNTYGVRVTINNGRYDWTWEGTEVEASNWLAAVYRAVRFAYKDFRSRPHGKGRLRSISLRIWR